MALILAVVALRAALRDEAFRLRWHRLLLRIPLVGRLGRATDCARFASTLAILTRSGVPLVEALAIAGEVIGNRVIRGEVLVAAQGQLTLDILWLSAAASPLVMLLSWLVRRYPPKLSLRAVRWLVFVLLLLAGGSLIAEAVPELLALYQG